MSRTNTNKFWKKKKKRNDYFAFSFYEFQNFQACSERDLQIYNFLESKPSLDIERLINVISLGEKKGKEKCIFYVV